ncbi:MAG: hypothetical protein GDA68_13635 [Nitrospira sp. CR2.1]|nr:hypothetical protein [Nitrospira sp. CR2.1]
MSDPVQRIERLSDSHRRLLRLRLAREERAGEARLVGYVVPHESTALTGRDLREFLSSRVPDYMVPSRWVFLEAWPTTTRGKVDRKALQALVRSGPDSSRERALPADQRERAVAAIWEEVLGVRDIGVHDNFFDLGGHSLLLPKVLTQLRAIADRDLSMVELFRYPTIRTLAAAMGGTQDAGVKNTRTQELKDMRNAGVRRLKQRRAQRTGSRDE